MKYQATKDQLQEILKGTIPTYQIKDAMELLDITTHGWKQFMQKKLKEKDAREGVKSYTAAERRAWMIEEGVKKYIHEHPQLSESEARDQVKDNLQYLANAGFLKDVSTEGL